MSNYPKESKVSDSPLAPAEQAELLIWLPGWRGYKERDLIRQDDILVRNFIRDYLLKILERVEDFSSKIALKSPLDPGQQELDILQAKIRTVIDEVISAPAGMLSYYARYKFTNTEQQALVDFDLKLLESVKNLLESTKETIDVEATTKQVRAIHDAFFERNKIFYPQKIQ